MADNNQNNPNQNGGDNNEPNFDLNQINSWAEKNELGLKFEDEGSLKNIFQTYSKIPEYEKSIEEMKGQLSTANVYKEKYDMVLDKLNNSNILPDKETLALKQLKDKYPDKDLGLISNIRGADINSMNKLDALVLASKLEAPSNVSDDARKRVILRQLGIEEIEEGGFSDEDRFAIDNAFASKKAVLDEIRGFQPEMQSFDFEEDYKAIQSKKEAEAKSKADEAEKLKAHNSKMIEPIFDSFKEIKRFYKDEKGKEQEVKYAVDEGFKGEFINKAVDELTNTGFKITPDNAQEVANFIESEYRNQNFDRILQMMAEQIVSQKEQDFHNRNHSDGDPNRRERPTDTSNQANLTVKERLKQRARRKN